MAETPSRRERGLRVLSLKVRDIVSEKNHTTYKQVAQTLINEKEEKVVFKEKVIFFRQKKNLKRGKMNKILREECMML